MDEETRYHLLVRNLEELYELFLQLQLKAIIDGYGNDVVLGQLAEDWKEIRTECMEKIESHPLHNELKRS